MPGMNELVPQSPDSPSFAWPQLEDEPLMQILEHRETERFEAEFALELSGVVLRSTSGAEVKTKSEESQSHRLVESVLTGMEAGDVIEFVYGRGEDGPFTWRVRGHVETDTAADAVSRAHELYGSLSSGMRAVDSDYRFLPVREKEGLERREDGRCWRGRIVSKGITVRAEDRNSIGFQKTLSASSTDHAILLPDPPSGLEFRHYAHLGSILLHSATPLELRLSLTKVVLDQRHLTRVAAALAWLRNGSEKEVAVGLQDPKGVERVCRMLEAWLRTTCGVHIAVTVSSGSAPPRQFSG